MIELTKKQRQELNGNGEPVRRPLGHASAGETRCFAEFSGKMDPNRIRFSQSSISSRFRDGRTIAELAEGLKSGQVRPEDVPPLRLVEKDGEYFTLDNRRLAAFRQAGVEIPWRLATAEEIANESFKFTTMNGGVSIKVRGETQ